MPHVARSRRNRLSSHRLAAVQTRCELLLTQTWTFLAEALQTYESASEALDASRLEPRILLSATPIASVLDADLMAAAAEEPSTLMVAAITPTVQAPAQQDSVRVELVVVDPRLADTQRLVDSLDGRAEEGTRFEILILDTDRDGLDQIGESLQHYNGVDAIHLFSHGTDGRVLIGSSLLTHDNLEEYAGQLSSWQSWLTDDADILIYGCDVAAGQAGQSFLTRIGELTSADIGASIDATGNIAAGGDWNLEFQSGAIATTSVVDSTLATQWTGLLQAITVTTTLDVVDGNTSSISALLASQGADGFVSLREAIIAANQTAGGDVIFLGDGNYQLSIAGINEVASLTGDLDILDELEIYGTGSSKTIIDGNGIDRVFSVRAQADVKMTDLTVRGGNAGARDGGGISVRDAGSSLILERVIVSSNTAFKGAGIFLQSGDLVARNSTFSSNTSNGFGGGIYNNQGDVVLTLSALLDNTATIAGGGIYHEGLSATLALTNVTVSGNSTSGEGGGIYSKQSASIVHSTIAYNSASTGGGIYVTSGETLAVQNSILAINTGGNANTTLTGSLGNNLSNDASSGLTHGTDIIIANTGLGTVGYYGGPTKTIAISATSAALDAGAATGATQVDQRGYTRDTSADIGAFEYQRLSATGEIQINTTVAADQQTTGSSIAVDAAGNYVVVWQGANQDGSGWGVFARRFSSRGIALTPEIQVNQYAAGAQRSAQVASDQNGNFVVTWSSELQDATASSVYARRFNADGTPLDNEFRVNTTNTGSQDSVVIAMDKVTGNFVVAWKGEGPGDADGIFFRRFSADGTSADVNDRLANSVDRGAEQDPTITCLVSGSFAIAWSQGASVYLQRFSADGSSLGSEVAISAILVTNDSPSLDSDSDGNFVLAYRDSSLLSGSIRARVFNADGTVKVSEFSVGAGTGGANPSVTMINGGSFLVVWDETGDSDGQAVKARQFDLNGNPLTAAYLVNTTQSGDQNLASAAALDVNNFVFVWSGESASDAIGIVARQFGGALPTNLAPIANDDSYIFAGGGTLQVDAYPDWYDQDWMYRQLLTVSLANPAAQLTDYPVLVRLHATAADSVNIDYAQFGSSGQDLRFVDADGNLLHYQIAQWDAAGYSEVWVEVPLLEADDAHNSFFMYYGNAAAVDAQQPLEIWDAGYAGVYHLNGTFDSEINTTSNGKPTSVTYSLGIAGQAAVFDGSNSLVNLGSDASIDDIFAGGGTIATWINPVSWGEGGAGRIVSKANTSSGGGGFVMKVSGTNNGDGIIVFEHDFSGTLGRWQTTPGSISLNSWQHVVVSYDNSNATNVPIIYIDGVAQTLVASSTPVGTAASDAGNNFIVGNFKSPTRSFDGLIDELRISTVIRDADRFAQDHHTIAAAPTTSAVQQSRPADVLLNDADADRDTLVVSLISGPAHASAFTLNANGSFIYQHDGTATTTDSFVYQVSDGQGGVSTATAFLGANTPPTLSAIANLTISEDTPSGAIALVIGDAESDPDDLLITLSSDNQALVDDGAIVLTGSGANRTLSFTPQSNATGTATITVTISDGLAMTSESFTVTVQAVNDSPDISAIANLTISEDTPSGAIALVIGDAESDPDDLLITLSSDNQALVDDGAIVLTGSGANRTLSFTPQSNATGTASITLTVTDGVSMSSRSFTVNVQAVNDVPVAVADSIDVGTFVTTPIYRSQILVNDSDIEADPLTVQVVTGPRFGTLEVLSGGDFRYRQTAYTVTGDSFSYRLWDGAAWSDPVSVTLNIEATPIVVVINVPEPERAPAETSESTSSSGTQSNSESTSTEGSAEAPTAASSTLVPMPAATSANSDRNSSSSEADISESGGGFGDADTTNMTREGSEELMTGFHSSTVTRGGQLGSLSGESKGGSAISSGIASYDITRDALSQPQLWLAMDSMRQEVASSVAMTGGITVGAAATTSVGMTVGYVVWVLRSGLLLSSVMAQLPMWRFMDPLTILDSSEPQTEEDRETLMSIADGEAPKDADEGPQGATQRNES